MRYLRRRSKQTPPHACNRRLRSGFPDRAPGRIPESFGGAPRWGSGQQHWWGGYSPGRHGPRPTSTPCGRAGRCQRDLPLTGRAFGLLWQIPHSAKCLKNSPTAPARLEAGSPPLRHQWVPSSFLNGIFWPCPPVGKGVRDALRGPCLKGINPIHEGRTLVTSPPQRPSPRMPSHRRSGFSI